ncbi:MAG: DUF4142 domain-containing protein [Pseudobdellovibrionaceae bacterium]
MRHINTFFGTVASLVLAAGMASAAQPAPPQPALNDSQMIGLMNKVNDVEVAIGKVAVEKGQNVKVKTFATKMVTEHTADNVKITALEAKTKLQRADSDASRALEQRSNTIIENLKNAKAADFDKAYIDNEVTTHQEVLNTLDQSLIPTAQNPDLKSFLQSTREEIASHLKEAQQIQSELTK